MNVFYSEEAYNQLNTHINQYKYSKIFILTDTNTNECCTPIFLPELATHIPIETIEIEAGEENKTIDTCVQLWNVLNELGADRKSLIIALGGGVITDIGGFVASVYKRGIHYINVPTSLLAMVDAAIGGKNGVDLGSAKNQVGTINPAQMVVVDFRFLDTLPPVQVRSGYAEMLKHGLIQDKAYWELLQNFSNINTNQIDELIITSIDIKNQIINQDPTEEGIRKALNFGHTLGHAIEGYCIENPNRNTLLHGEAIAIGMILESYISYKKNYISQEDYQQIKNTFKQIYPFVEFDKTEIEQIIQLTTFDKKNENGKIYFTLLDTIGNVSINQQVATELIYEAFDDYYKD
ncbi:MAG: 3-dehydroquinate synthase [Bacteroidota bacterium]|nr:3-dehydroquinate synthase [Bacteroidota bacterium]